MTKANIAFVVAKTLLDEKFHTLVNISKWFVPQNHLGIRPWPLFGKFTVKQYLADNWTNHSSITG